MYTGTHLCLCLTVSPCDGPHRPHPMVMKPQQQKDAWVWIFLTVSHCLFLFLCSTSKDRNSDYHFMWRTSAEELYTCRNTLKSVKVYVWLFSLLLFWNLVLKWWISCAVTQQWNIYHTGKRKAELPRLTSQVSTCWQLNQYRSTSTAQLMVLKPLFYWNVLKFTITYHVYRLVLSLPAWNREWKEEKRRRSHLGKLVLSTYRFFNC